MNHLPILRWGEAYESLDVKEVTDFRTGEPLARVSQANGGLVSRDLRRASAARHALRTMSAAELFQMCQRAADSFLHETLDLGSGYRLSPDAFVEVQARTTGIPVHLCRANMRKIHHVLSNMEPILDALTRGLDPDIFARGFGNESRGVTISYVANSPVLAAVLPSNSPGVHALWLPAIPLRVGLALKPGSAEPWTPYRIAAAMLAAGIPKSAIGIYPGDHDAGQAMIASCDRVMVFGSAQTVEQYANNPRVQVHGPGFSKILIGDDVVDQWQAYIDVMLESIVSNAGRSCINCSAIYASRHSREIGEALASRLGPIAAAPIEDDESHLAAFTLPDQAAAIWSGIQLDLQEVGVEDLTSRYGERLQREDRHAYLRPLIVHCDGPARRLARQEYMFPCAAVVQCPQPEMLSAIGPSLVVTAITEDANWIDELLQARHIDRLNIGPIPTNRLNWLQPHEGNIVEFLYRSRACQFTRTIT